MIMKLIKLIISIAALFLLVSCEYEDYIEDFDFSGTYFASQQPLRTIVAGGTESFEVGVTIAGLRNDDGSQWVDFEIDSLLLDSLPEASGLKLLPESYYTLGDPGRFNIVKSFLRTVKVELTEEFFNDPLALANTYALPLRIVDKSMAIDSIMGFNVPETTVVSSENSENMDITIVVVKYVSPYSGTYYAKGVQYTLNAAGMPTDTTMYSIDELSLNKEIEMESLGVNSVETSQIGANLFGGIKLDMSTGSVTVSSDDVMSLQVDEASYADGVFTLKYTVESFGQSYRIEEELIQRQSPELDLRFEEWK